MTVAPAPRHFQPSPAALLLPAIPPVSRKTYSTKTVGGGKTLVPGGSVTDGNGGANYDRHLR